MLGEMGVAWRTVIGRLNVVDILYKVQSIYGALFQQRCVAQVVRHHD